jgi:hypothetical protein
VRHVRDQVRERIPREEVEIKSAIAGSSGVVVEAVLRGTNTGPLQDPAGEMPATDKSVEMPFVIFLVKSETHV